MWNTIKELSIILFVGLSFYATSFVASLPLGTAAAHPILGTVDELVRSLQLLVITALLFYVTMRLYDKLQPHKEPMPRLPRTFTIR